MSGMSAEAICGNLRNLRGKLFYLVAEALEAWWLRLSKPKPRYLQKFKRFSRRLRRITQRKLSKGRKYMKRTPNLYLKFLQKTSAFSYLAG
jgi:hypothetical protein